ncbi:uncharacterized protein PAC_14265 [Phialocephala subalpina]|uniref:Uncharacterized protein n=1 Tax=Phialocephala subalpina TaxID=576137 RepID=A0A1L7XHE7_9HELO|nr:uncharacterized protein PAC_14265 [Phialocephala subalpina]
MTQSTNSTNRVSLSRSRTIWQASKLQNITGSVEARYMWTFIALVVFAIVLFLQLDSHTRRRLEALEAQNKTTNQQIASLQEEIKELRNEREKREVVLRREVGKAREEIMAMEKEFDELKVKLQKEREVDRSVDMEEKLCLIRGLREVAAAKDAEYNDSGVDDGTSQKKSEGNLKGPGIYSDISGNDDGVSDTSDEDLLHAERDANAAWEGFDEVCRGMESQAEARRGSNETLIDLDGETPIEDDQALPTQGERLFPLVPPPKSERRALRRSITYPDPAMEARLSHIFELEGSNVAPGS